MSRIAIVESSQLLTLAGPPVPRVGADLGQLGIIEGGAVLIDGSKIVACGTTAEIRSLISPSDEVVDARNKVVMPGWVDAHTHPVFGGDRVREFEMRSLGATYQEIAASGGGIMSTVRATRSATEAELVSAACHRARWFLEHGTTTIEAKSGYGLDLESEMKMLRAVEQIGLQTALRVVPTFLGAHGFPPEFADDREGYLQYLVDAMIPAAAQRARFADIFVEKGYFDGPQARRYANAIRAHGLGLRMHVDQLSDGGGADLAAELGAVTADHLEQTSESGILALARQGVMAVLLPASVLGLGLSKYPDARKMIDAGIAPCLATDFNPGSSPTTSMPLVLALACRQLKMSPAEAISAATINPAHSLGLAPETGSLEAGKSADIAMYDCADYREIAYYLGVDLASAVWARGVRVR